MWLNAISGQGAGSLVHQWGSTIKSTTGRYPSWYDLKWCKDVQQQTTNQHARLALYRFSISVRYICLWQTSRSSTMYDYNWRGAVPAPILFMYYITALIPHAESWSYHGTSTRHAACSAYTRLNALLCDAVCFHCSELIGFSKSCEIGVWIVKVEVADRVPFITGGACSTMEYNLYCGQKYRSQVNM